jgi:hypothetical protein
MGWWRAENGVDLLGDGPADTLYEVLEEMRRLHGCLPKLGEVLNAAVGALRTNPAGLLLDPNPPIIALRAELNDGTSEVTTNPPSVEPGSVKWLRQALEDIAVEYQDTEERRKPSLSEVLETLAFILGPDDQQLVKTPNGRGVRKITPTRESR